MPWEERASLSSESLDLPSLFPIYLSSWFRWRFGHQQGPDTEREDL